jgi:hypothetical protein
VAVAIPHVSLSQALSLGPGYLGGLPGIAMVRAET